MWWISDNFCDETLNLHSISYLYSYIALQLMTCVCLFSEKKKRERAKKIKIKKNLRESTRKVDKNQIKKSEINDEV